MWVNDRDLYICSCYISPSTSQLSKQQDITSETLIEIIQEDCANFKTKGNVMVMGAFNAWVSKNSTDYIENDSADEFSFLPDGVYTPDVLLLRKTMELGENNKNGNCSLNLCKDIRILNGRSFGDSLGKFTRYLLKDFESPSVAIVVLKHMPRPIFPLRSLNDPYPTSSSQIYVEKDVNRSS